jgi:hypothetical protein
MKVIERRVAFAQRDGVLFGNVRKQLAETPDTALVKGIGRRLANGRAPAKPERAQFRWIAGQIGRNKFKQIAAVCAPEVLSGGTGTGSAADAAQAKSKFSLIGFHFGRQRLDFALDFANDKA